MSHYADYIKEREGFEIVEGDQGFMSFIIKGDECYIRDAYVAPEARMIGAGRMFMEEIEKIAKERGCSKISGSVRPSANHSTESMKALLAGGFQLHSASADAIWFVKGVS